MKRPGHVLTPLALVLLASSFAGAAELPSINAYAGAAALNSSSSTSSSSSSLTARTGNAAPAAAASVDEKRGVPTFLWASLDMRAAPPALVGASAEQAARAHLERLAPNYGLDAAALSTAKVNLIHDTGRGGIIVGFGQEVSGVEVFQTRMRLLLTRSNGLIAVAGNLQATAIPSVLKGNPFPRSMPSAVADALGDLYGLPRSASSVVDTKTEKSGYRYFGLAASPAVKAAGVSFNRPARVKKVLFPMPDRLIPAYYVEIQAQKAGAAIDDGYAYVIAADDGRTLYRQSLIAFESFDYRVWADDSANHRPLDDPYGDYTPHPTGLPDGYAPGFVAPSLITMEGFNKSPNGTPDPWLPVGAVESVGNNVDAYTDHGDPDGYSNGDVRATVTAPGVFDRTYDVALDPIASTEQSMAAVTQLFYVNNWLHDWFYDSGFNEAAGNGQKSNFGRGGAGNDPLHCEAQDGVLTGKLNNANMNTPADGESPRMQMYVWSGKETRTLGVQPLNTNLQTGTAGFGAVSYDVNGELALPDDGTDPVTDACEPIVTSLAGKIALIDRGVCTFKLKTYNAEQAGAIAVIITNNAPVGDPKGGITGMSDGDPSLTVTIPSLFITKEDGDAIKAAMASGAVTAAMFRDVKVTHDGTIDNGVIGHEWGHYFHHRLVNCGGVVCGAMSEGWGDFTALQLVLREGDNLDGTFATGAYAGSADVDAAYYGIRRAPYSTDMKKNPFTFKHMTTGEPLPQTAPLATASSNNAEVHNSGEIWSEMMFESFISLLKTSQGPSATRTFEEARRAMSDYVVAGMMLTPPNPTYGEQRDAILAAAYAASPDDALLIATAFAKRGAGSCAVSPARFSSDNSGLVESFELKPRVAILSTAIDDGVKSCDDDGYLDAEETGKVTVELMNPSLVPLGPTQIEITSSTAGVTFPSGPFATVNEIKPFETIKATIDVALTEEAPAIGNLDFTVNVMNVGACQESVSTTSAPRINFDNVAEQSTTDTFESDIVAWTTDGAGSDAVWARASAVAPNHVAHGVDSGSSSDTRFVSPPLNVAAQGSFILSFKHAYQFETSYDNPQTPEDETVYWDGAVIEITSDGGKNWQDISVFGDPSYKAPITGTDASNVLLGRPAYVERNALYPNANVVTIDMGEAFAGKTVQVRFRIGTDASGSGDGWTIDDIEFQGITNKPFPTVIDDVAVCEHAPIADAGKDATVSADAFVTLNGTGSSDADGDPLTFSWAQIDGPAVDLADADTAKATFDAPVLDAESTLTFEVTVTDGKKSAKDSVVVQVRAKPVVSDDGSGGSGGKPDNGTTPTGGGCDCSIEAGSQSRTQSPLGAMLASAFVSGLSLFRRRARKAAR